MKSEELFFGNDDLLNRGRYAQNLRRIIEDCNTLPKSNDNKAFVIGIDSPWGTGKTFFVKMFENYLRGEWTNSNVNEYNNENNINEVYQEDTEHGVVYYNAWENDFWDNAFEPLFDKLIQAERICTKVEDDDIIELVKSAAKIVALGIKGFLSKALEEIIDNSVIDDIIAEANKLKNNAITPNYQTNELFPQYSQFKDAISNLRKYLEQAVESNDEKIVIIIDELDRCKPIFAIQTLEIVKHLFNVKGLVFVFALDIHQLSHCVKNVYGAEMDAVGYLERFFNYITMLPTADVRCVIDNYCNEFGIHISEERVRNNINEIIRMFALSLRDIRTILCSFCILQRTTLLEYNDIPNAQILYFYFLTLKYKKPQILKEVVLMNNYTRIGAFLNDYPIPFICESTEDISKIYKALLSKKNIADIPFFVVSYNTFDATKTLNVYRICGQTIMFRSGEQKNMSEEHNLSFVLYYPDIINWEDIKEYTVIEYLYRQIEQCDFLTKVEED